MEGKEKDKYQIYLLSIFVFNYWKLQATALRCLYKPTVNLHYYEAEIRGNYTCKSLWESQQHIRHMFLPSSFPAHGKAHEPWTPEVKRWEMHSWRSHWLAVKKTERFRYCMKNPSYLLVMVLWIIPCVWSNITRPWNMQVITRNVCLFFHISHSEVLYGQIKGLGRR